MGILAKAIIDKVSNEGVSPLYIAAQHGHVNVCEKLMHAKAIIDKTTYSGHTALAMAQHKGHGACVRLLSNAESPSSLPATLNIVGGSVFPNFKAGTPESDELGVRLLARRKNWGSLETSWLAKNAFAEWRGVLRRNAAKAA